MKGRFLIGIGILSLLGFAVSTQWHAADVPVAFYLPDAPIVKRVEQAVTHSSPSPVASSGMDLLIPAINVRAPIEVLGLNNGELALPVNWDDAGWYDISATPGDSGTAVIVGHVDSHTGPAVFFHLSELRPGDRVVVDRGGSALSFRVLDAASYPESSPKLNDIFSRSGPSRLVLLTCSGDFNRATQRYTDRLMVEAALVE